MDSNEIVLTRKSSSLSIILNSIVNSTKKLLILIWFLFKSFCSNIYSRQKVIRNQIVLITGSGGSLGKFLNYTLNIFISFCYLKAGN